MQINTKGECARVEVRSHGGFTADLRERHDDQERPIEFLDLNQVSKQGNGLDGFSQTHLISQDAIQGIIVQWHKPLQASHLKMKITLNFKPKTVLANVSVFGSDSL